MNHVIIAIDNFDPIIELYLHLQLNAHKADSGEYFAATDIPLSTIEKELRLSAENVRVTAMSQKEYERSLEQAFPDHHLSLRHDITA